jgi:hypothetical protein
MLKLLVIFFLSLPTCLLAQVGIPQDSVKTDTTKVVKPDTILYVPKLDTTREVPVMDTVNFEEHLIQNPTKALFKSLVVPGWGQIGNHRYLKAGLFAGLEAWFVIEAIHYGGQASDWKKQYEAAGDVPTRNALYAIYRSKYTARSKYIWFAGITTFVSIFDAYVDAHLSGEPTPAKTGKVSLSLIPSASAGPGATLALNF